MQALRIFVEGGDAAQPQASFNRQGGTIGRADNNTLVLSDPERSVSRLHARVEWRDDRFLLVNMGINPVVCNGAMLSTADEAALADGDTLRIGRFVLRVQRVDSLADPVLEADREALFDDMTGLPLPRKPGAAPTMPVDISLFDARSVTAPAPPVASLVAASGAHWLAELREGMGIAALDLPTALGPRQLGAALRQALDEAWQAAAGDAGPHAGWTVFEQALVRACRVAGDEAEPG